MSSKKATAKLPSDLTSRRRPKNKATTNSTQGSFSGSDQSPEPTSDNSSRAGSNDGEVAGSSTSEPSSASLPDFREEWMNQAPQVPALSSSVLNVICAVNGKQNLSFFVNPNEECVMSPEHPAEPDIQAVPLFNGKLELKVVWCTPETPMGPSSPKSPVVNSSSKRSKRYDKPQPATPQQRPVHYRGTLIIDGGAEHFDLGPLQVKPVICAKLVDHPPQTFQLVLQKVETPAFHPSELLLRESVQALLDNNEYGGSESVSHVQNWVREFPFYSDVVGEHGLYKDFVTFAEHHTEAWNLFKYVNEVPARSGNKLLRMHECRIVSKLFAEDYQEGDVTREIIKKKCCTELYEYLKDVLKEGPMPQHILQEKLGKQNFYLTLISPNYKKILEMFLTEPDKYFVCWDRYHPIFVEMRNPDVVDPFVVANTAFDCEGGGNPVAPKEVPPNIIQSWNPAMYGGYGVATPAAGSCPGGEFSSASANQSGRSTHQPYASMQFGIDAQLPVGDEQH